MKLDQIYRTLSSKLICCLTMTDVCPSLNPLIIEHKCKPIEPVDYAFDRINEFLKEAYQIVG